MKIASMHFYCLIFLCAFLSGETLNAKEKVELKNKKSNSPAYFAVAPPTFYPVYFKDTPQSNYNWTAKTISPVFEIKSFEDESGAVSLNYLKAKESGSIMFRVSDSKSVQAIGFSKSDSKGHFPDILAGIKQVGRQFFFIEKGKDVKELGTISPGKTVKLTKEGDAVKVLVEDVSIYSHETSVDHLNLHVTVSFGAALSNFINLNCSFQSKIDIKAIHILPQGVKGKGSIDISLNSQGEFFSLWGNATLLSQSEFNQKIQSWNGAPNEIQDLSYDEYLRSFPLTRNELPHGRYSTAITDKNGEKIRLNIDVPSESRWTGDEGVKIEGSSIFKTSRDNSWKSGKATSDNVFHPNREGRTHFQFNKRGEAAIGLRSLKREQGESYSALSFGFYFSEGYAIPVRDGKLLPEEKVLHNEEDFLGFEVQKGKIYYLKNGSKILELSAEMDFKHVLDISLLISDSKFDKVEFSLVPKWPVIGYEQTNSICGKIVQTYTLKVKESFIPKGSYVYNYKWRNENGDVVSSSIELKDVPAGQYTLTYTVIYPSGLGQSVYSPVTYLVGYKAFWTNMIEVENVPGTNSIRNTLESYNSNIHTGETSNYLNPGSSEWIYFEVKAPVNSLGNVVYPSFFDRLYGINFQSYSGTSHLSTMVRYFGGTSQSLSISNGSNLFLKSVTAGDRVLIKIVNGNKVRLSVNGQNVTSVNGNLLETFGGITTPSILGFRASFSSASSFNSKIGPGNVITSFPCADMTYLDLKRKVDGSYYPARFNSLGFRYIEEYLPASGVLNYRVLDRNNKDVFVTNGVTPPTVFRLVGDNKCEIDLSAHRTILPSGFYILEVTNDKDEKRYMRFRLY